MERRIFCEGLVGRSFQQFGEHGGRCLMGVVLPNSIFEETDMNKLQMYSVAFVIAFIILLAKLTSATDSAKPVQLVSDGQVKALKASIALKDAKAELQDLVSQFNALNQQMADLRAKAPDAQKKVVEAQKALDGLKDELAKGLGLDPSKYTLDVDKLVPVPSDKK